LNLKKESRPFLSSNILQAKSRGKIECDEKKPMPAIALYGLFNLNKNGAPALITLKEELPPGCQKFISSFSLLERKLYQSKSVTPT
jgi:hypothetical protein